MEKTTTALVEREARHSPVVEYARGIERRRRVNVINARERVVKLVGGCLNLGARLALVRVCLRLRRTWGSLVCDNLRGLSVLSMVSRKMKNINYEGVTKDGESTFER